MGLADRIEALGGKLEVASPPGEGTLIAAELPTRTDSSVEAARSAERPPAGDGALIEHGSTSSPPG
jgi:hypothetical protein